MSGWDPVLELNVRVPPAIGPIRTGWVLIVALTPEELTKPIFMIGNKLVFLSYKKHDCVLSNNFIINLPTDRGVGTRAEALILVRIPPEPPTPTDV